MADHLSATSLDWANTHIKRFGDTDLFPVPFEFEAIRHSWLSVRDSLSQIDLETYEGRPLRRFLVPKPTGGFRAAIQLDPLDALLFTAMVRESAEQLESQRAAEDQRIACSYRLDIDAQGQFFKRQDGWSDFIDRSRELAESGSYEYVVLADIADFYNQISLHRVRNIMESAGVSSSRAKNVEHFLMNLTRGHSRGLPVGPSASILLAEACLSDVDSFLLRTGYTHTRYVDDFRIFCSDETEAVRALHDLSEYLYTAHRLALRPDKTEPVPIADFRADFLLDPEQLEEETRSARLEMLADLLENYAGYNVTIDDIPDTDRRQAIIDNLSELFDACVNQSPIHLGWARYLLRQATSLRTNVILTQSLDNLNTLAPVMRDLAGYLKMSVRPATAAQIGDALADFAKTQPKGKLPYVRLWVLDILVSKLSGSHEEAIREIASDSAHMGLSSRPSALLAKELGHIEWVRQQKETWQNFAPWDRRAVIWSADALSDDERGFWLRRVENAGDPLDGVVAKGVSG